MQRPSSVLNGIRFFATATLLLSITERSLGDEVPKRIDELQKIADRQAARHNLTVETDPAVQAVMVEKPVIRFVMERCEGAFIYLWTIDKQPVAVAQIWHRRFPNRDKPLWLYQFRSLTSDPLLLKTGNRVQWQPGKGGIHWEAFDGVPAPAASPVARRSQRKQLARKFSGVVEMGDEGSRRTYTLHLKPRELYVYSSSTEGQLIDGSIFWFARDDGNDPELLLMVEAIGSPKHEKWRYSLINFTSYPVDVSLEGDVVKSFASSYNSTSFQDHQHVWSYTSEN